MEHSCCCHITLNRVAHRSCIIDTDDNDIKFVDRNQGNGNRRSFRTTVPVVTVTLQHKDFDAHSMALGLGSVLSRVGRVSRVYTLGLGLE